MVRPFVIVVADRDATVGVISSMLLSSALATTLTTVQTQVRVLVEPQFITGVKAPELPEEIRKIEELAISASPADIESASLIVAFSGVDMNKLTELRERGVAVPAVNLCQFVEHLEETAHHKATPQVQVQEVMTSAALQFGFGGGSSTCSICEAQEKAAWTTGSALLTPVHDLHTMCKNFSLRQDLVCEQCRWRNAKCNA